MTESTALSVAPTEVAAFTKEQLSLIKDTVAREQKLTDDEFRLFIYAAQRQGLDPLARQIYAVKRKGKMVLQTAIDGYRLIAQRTGEYAGNDDPVFAEVSGKPVKATVTVRRIVNGDCCAFSASARWDEYCPVKGQDFMWQKMPYVMLGKCAEALALRKAFPAELSGTYVDAEMDQAGRQDTVLADSDGVVQDSITRDTVLDWGGQKFKGKTIKELPDWALEWGIQEERDIGEDWQGAMREELELRRENKEAESSD